MARTHTFKGSASGYGYAAFIEDDQLVITEDWGREGGVIYRGPYRDAKPYLSKLCEDAPRLYNDIKKYYTNNSLADFEALEVQFKQKRGYDERTATVLFKVQLFMDNRQVHNVLVRGRSQSGVVEKLMPKIPEVLMLQTWDAMEFAVRSEKISAVVFVED